MSQLRAILVGLFLVGCGQESTPAPTQVPTGPLPVTVVIAQRSQVSQTGLASGKVEVATEVEVRSGVNGTLQNVGYKEGDQVKTGDLLFRIDSAPYTSALTLAQATLREVTVRTEAARAEVERLSKLPATNSETRRAAEISVQVAESDRAAAVENVRLAERNLADCEIRAPIDGIAGRSLRTPGARINSGGLLATVAQTGVVRVRFGLSEPEFYRLYNSQAAAAASAAVRIQLPNDDLHPAVGKVDFAATEIDRQLGSVQFRALFENADGSLTPGQIVRVQVAGLKVSGFLIPQSALVQSTSGRIVMVVVGGKAEGRAVALGDISGDNISILSGLVEGDQVIVDHAQRLRVGTAVVTQSISPAVK